MVRVTERDTPAIQWISTMELVLQAFSVEEGGREGGRDKSCKEGRGKEGGGGISTHL